MGNFDNDRIEQNHTEEDVDVVVNDPVTKPVHYTEGAVECIDAIESMLNQDGKRSYHQGQVLRYLWRNKLNRKQDLRKAEWHLQRLLSSYE